MGFLREGVSLGGGSVGVGSVVLAKIEKYKGLTFINGDW